MGFWKVVGGAALGVAAVAALPVAGPIGAVTAVGAAVAAGVGATAGGVAEYMDADVEQAEARGRREGKNEGKAESAVKVKTIEKKMEQVVKKNESLRAWEEMTIGLFAVGASLANCDGRIDEAERNDMEQFIAGLSSSSLSSDFHETLDKLFRNPPSFEEAMKYVEKYILKENRDMIDDLLVVAAEADGQVCENEKAFIQAWNEYKHPNHMQSASSSPDHVLAYAPSKFTLQDNSSE